MIAVALRENSILLTPSSFMGFTIFVNFFLHCPASCSIVVCENKICGGARDRSSRTPAQVIPHLHNSQTAAPHGEHYTVFKAKMQVLYLVIRLISVCCFPSTIAFAELCGFVRIQVSRFLMLCRFLPARHFCFPLPFRRNRSDVSGLLSFS